MLAACPPGRRMHLSPWGASQSMLQGLIDHRFEIWLVLVPLVVLSGGRDEGAWSRSLRLLCLALGMYALNHWAVWVYAPMTGAERCCSWSEIITLRPLRHAWYLTMDIIYVGWWELLRRLIFRQLFFRPAANCRYGIVSNLFILVSVILPTLFASFFIYIKLP